MTQKNKTAKSRGGRPSRQQAGQVEEKIFAAATALFLRDGYGAVSIESVAQQAGISKRTFYARFANKEDLFRAVVRGILQKLHPPQIDTDQLFQGGSAEEILRRIAPIILQASLSAQGLALHRVVMAEALRFPELALVMNEQGMRQEAIERIGAVLQQAAREAQRILPDPAFAAEQFLHMITSAPQRRALGLGKPMTPPELAAWAEATVDLFLHGYLGGKNRP